MKYELETIPVWDAIKDDKECFLCTLMKQSEQDAVSYYLGSSVMHPETRVSINKTGFCPSHWTMLAQSGAPQSLALIIHTYLGQTKKELEKVFSMLGPTKEGKKTQSVLQKIAQVVRHREEGCLICSQMEKRLLRYTYTTVQLWKDDHDFRLAFETSKGVCLHHMQSLFSMASETLGPLQAKAFSVALTHLTALNLQRLEDDVLWMTQKYKAENIEKSWNGCEDAHKRAVMKLVGESRLIDPL
ncbi:MAG: DUF6062 family protein [Sphaerochaetaceae bacterium]|jgi:hypothetical protein|nr:DUF6062 family protein [Sphaerochaetaceae bacterium]NLO61671.1 hypothetical protein [Spirochaetales bacterium]MDD3670468.1 DUF6062 family protein [Sphaerochaetaceae bacterium]MDD4840488.1 DUF6062 family protein [Sphaerochaetaceae bacterium]MDD5076443.1 DUF6062 family protein [Sphaerochaetaceae bacterium]